MRHMKGLAMKNELLEYLLVNVSLLVLVAAVLIELGPLRQLLKKQNRCRRPGR